MFRGALIGFAVALLMCLPPILHFVTGPLGPLVGGFIGGYRTRISLTGAMSMGLLMGLFVTAPVAGLLAFGSVTQGFLPLGVRDVLMYVGIAIIGYTGFLGSIGAAIGGHLAHQQAIRDGSAGSDL